MTTTTRIILLLVSATVCSALQKQSLNGEWILDGGPAGFTVPAQVPGGVFSNLMDNQTIGDIFWKNGDLGYSWIGQSDWIYNTSVTVDEDLLAYRVVDLVFEGLDTFATIYVNGAEIGNTDNMFRRYVFNVKNHLKVGLNEISVKFTSAVNKAKAIADNPNNPYVIPPECPAEEYHGICYANRIRKMQASFSWDWGPAFASAGIWKDVYLRAFDDAVIDYIVATSSKTSDDLWTLTITTYLDGGDLDSISGTTELSLQLDNSVIYTAADAAASKNEYSEIAVTTSIAIPSNQITLWWPNELGPQQLYSLTVTYYGENDNDKDQKTVRVAFRTIEVVQEELSQGLSFYFKVNGYPMFARGANEIPLSVLPEKGQDRDYTKMILESARDVHMNMLRVWGGGVYESDYFYDLADEYGLLIWQDFMFACAMYPADEAYLSNVREEIRHQVKRLGSHPSLAMWSGNNENEGALSDNWYETDKNYDVYKQDYVKLYVGLVEEETKRLIPNVNYVTSSPSNGLESNQEGYVADWPGNPLYGDIHFYDYEKDSWDVETYYIPRFASEYGYQAMPSLEAWYTATDSIDDLLPTSSFMDYRQHHPDGNQQNLNLTQLQLQLPDPSHPNYVPAYIYYSQILQAQSIKIQTEHYRSFKGRLTPDGYGNTMGALYWQLNDVWVAPTWSSIDFTGRWKMLHYASKDFLNPMIVTGRWLNEALEIYAITDHLQAPNVSVKAVMHIYKWDSLQPLVAIEYPVTMDPLASVQVTVVEAQSALISAGCDSDYDEAKKNCFFHLHLKDQDNNNLVPFNYVFPEKLKDSNVADANVEIASVTAVDEEGYEYDIEVTTDAVALFVWLDTHTIIGKFSENGFLQVLPSKTVRFRANWAVSLDEMKEKLTVTHVKDKAYM